MNKRGIMKQFGNVIPYTLMLCMLLPVGSALAQDLETEGQGASFFIKRGFEMVPKRTPNQDEANPLESNTYINNLLDDVDKVLATNQDGLKWNGIDQDPEIPQNKKINTVVRKNQVNQYQPLAGHQNLLGAEAIQKAYDQALEGPVAEWNITLTQTEPAIAAGVHNALVQTANTLNARYLSELVFYDQLDSTQPWARTKVLNAYNNCIQKELQANQKTWYEALQICSGDSANQTSITPDYKDAQLPQKTGQTGAMWNVANHHRHQADGQAEKDGEDIVSVVDELFAELLELDGSQQAQDAKDSWLELFGDVQFHAISQQDTQVGSQDVTENSAQPRQENKGAYSTTELKIVRVPPTKRAAVVLGTMIQDRYSTLLEELKGFCDAKAGGQGPYSPHTTSGTQDYQRYKQEYWQADADDDNMQLLSTEGYVMNSAVGNLFLEVAVDAYSADGSDLNATCSKFTEFRNYKSIQLDSRDHDIASIYWNYAKFVAYGQLLSSYKSAMLFAMERSAEPGTTAFQYKMNAIKMILEVARTDNIALVQLQNVQKLRAFLSYVYKKKTQGSGMGGTQVTASVRGGAGGTQKK